MTKYIDVDPKQQYLSCMAAFSIVNFNLDRIAERKERRRHARLLAQTAQPKQIVILDTNTLFTKRDDQIFNGKTSEILSECRKFTSVRILIPRVCFLERLFQKNFDTNARFSKVQRELGALEELVGHGLQGYDAPTNLKGSIYRRAIEWCEHHVITIVRTPTNSIIWNGIIRDSIWRNPPFEPYNPDSEKRTEKGFRDAMVLATVNKIVADNVSPRIAFVCNDRLLRDTALEQNKKATNLSVYSSTSDFLSALKLETQNVSRFLSETLIKIAPKIFYDPANSQCIFETLDLASKIKREQSFNMYYIFQELEGESGYLKPFVPLTDEQIRIGNTTFDRIDESGRYHWQSYIAFACGYKEGEEGQDQIRGVMFIITWNCKFTENATYSDVVFESITFNGVLGYAFSSRKNLSNSLDREAESLLDRLEAEVMGNRPETI